MNSYQTFISSFSQHAHLAHVAIKDFGGCYTYQELESRSNDIASAIKATGAKGNGRIAVCLPKTREFVATVIAIWKCRCSYVPIDTSFPQERKSFIVNDCQAQLLIDEEGLHPQPGNAATAEGEAYVIYTSGTTGQPKGVPIRHSNLAALYYNFDQDMEVDEATVFLQFASLTFDVSLMDMFYPLTRGATVKILPEEERHDIALLSTYIDHEQITHAYLPPALLSMLPMRRYASLRYLWVAGEPAPEHLLQNWAKEYTVYNIYGPTETVGGTYNKVEPNSEHNDIGMALTGTTCYVLDPSHNIVGDDEEGELYIGGEQVMGGYVNRPDLDENVFIDNPYASQADRQA